MAEKLRTKGGAEADFVRGHNLLRHASTLALRLGILPNVKGLQLIGNIGQLRGMSEGSIIGMQLAYPHGETGGLVYEHATDGRWLGYDFRGPDEQVGTRKQPPSHLGQGKLFAAMLEEVARHSSSDVTPSSLLNLGSVDHILRFEPYNEETLVDAGMLNPTTYREAYQEVGVYEQFAEDLERRSLTNQPIHTVTPKGNTLVMLFNGSDSGRGVQSAMDIDRELDKGFRIA